MCARLRVYYHDPVRVCRTALMIVFTVHTNAAVQIIKLPAQATPFKITASKILSAYIGLTVKK